MNISHRIEHNICIITIEGDLAMEGTNQMRAYVKPFLEDQSLLGMLINFQKVELISSEGINVTVHIFKALQDRQTELALCGITPSNEEFFRITGVDRIINIYPTEEEAMVALWDKMHAS